MVEEPVSIFGGTNESVWNAGDYSADWAEYRRIRLKFFLIWLGYVPGVAVIALTVQFLFHTFVPAFFAAFAWGIWFLMAAAEIAQFPGPRCGEPFAHMPGSWKPNLWIFAWKCQNCGLKKFT
jgi:hypothetical protein